MGWRMIGLVLAVSVVLAAGCVEMGEVRAFRDRAAALSEQWGAESRAWAQRLEGMTPDDPLRPDVEAALARARAKEAAAQAAVQQVDLLIQRAANPDDALGQAVEIAAPWIPAPARAPLALGAALVAALVRAAQLKRGMISIARGINKAMEEDDQFRAGFQRHANTFRAIQTPLAKRVVDEASGRRIVRLPV